MQQVRTIPFNSLSADARKRFVDAVQHGQGAIVLTKATVSLGWAMVGWAFLAATGFFTIVIAWGERFGSTYRPVQGFAGLAVYAFALWFLLWGVLGIVRGLVKKGAYPYKPGRYLFPGALVDARTDLVTIYPIEHLVSLRGVHHHTNGVYSGTNIHFTFAGQKAQLLNVRGKARAEELMAQIEHYRRVSLDPITASDPAVRASMDPLYGEQGPDPALAGLLNQPSAMPTQGLQAKKVPAVIARAGLVSLVLGAALSFPLWQARNKASDAEAYDHLMEFGQTYDYEGYIYGGGLRADEVREQHMPRAVLNEAGNSVSALRAFIMDYPEHESADEARDRIRVAYAGALEQFRLTSTAPPETLAFVEAMIQWLQDTENATVAVNFEPPSTELLDVVDEILRSEETNVAAVAPHFNAAANDLRQTTIVSNLQSGFEQVFPNEMVVLSTTAAAENVPSIDVAYTVGPSAMVYELDNSSRVYSGIMVTFDVSMSVPEFSETLAFTLEVEPPQTFQVQDYGYGYGGGYDPYATDPYGGGSISDTTVYNTMASRAFDQLSTRINQSFFGGVGMQGAPGIPK